MDGELKKQLSEIAGTIRQLSIEAVQKADSGHPGLPLGCADMGAYLYGHLLRHNPKNSKWENRDRFVLSAGHGSMFLYSCLHLAGFNLSLDEIKRFRQLDSVTPGHPEYGMTDGVESTTGPLGQGVGNAIGQALGYKILAEKFNTSEHRLFNNKIYCLAGDGCLMEGVSQEACSFAGHLNLNNLVLIFDSNRVTLDGPLPDCGSDDIAKRFKSFGFDVLEMNGHDLEDIHETFKKIELDQKRPVLIIAHTIIGQGSPNKAGTSKAHGSPLGEEELKLTKKALGLPDEPFFVSEGVKKYFAAKLQKDGQREQDWKKLFESWKAANPKLYEEYQIMVAKKLPGDFSKQLMDLEIKGPMAGRNASQAVINRIAKELPYLYGGSADLSGSDCTMMKDFTVIMPTDFKGRNLKYGIREFGMATIAAGLFQTGFITPFIGTFLTFSDYMRNAIRLASLSHYQVIYQFTHDSIFLGEDGPTHQPIEHLAALRALPNLHVFRPADNFEVKGAWLEMLKYKGPSTIILSRQKLPDIARENNTFEETTQRGAYIAKREKGNLAFVLLATGSEVSLAMEVAKELETHGKPTRVVSMPCWALFEKQSPAYIQEVLGPDSAKHVSIEAACSMGWHKWIGRKGIAIAIDRFGASAPIDDLARVYGFTKEAIVKRVLSE